MQKKGAKLLIISLVFFAPFFAWADYTPVQNQDYTYFDGRGEEFIFTYTATSTHKIKTLSVQTCSSTGTSYPVYFVAYTGNNANPDLRHAVATSSTGYTSSTCSTFATTSVTFSPSLDVVPDVTISFREHHGKGIETADYPKFLTGISDNSPLTESYPVFFWSGTWETGESGDWSGFFTTNASGTPPNPEFCGPGNPNCTPAQPISPECSFTDLGGCIATAGAWIFYPSSESLEKLNYAPVLASTSPAGYLINFGDLIDLMEASTGTPLKIAINFSNFNGLPNALGNASSSVFEDEEVTFFDSCQINSYTQGLYSTWILNALTYALWLSLFGFYLLLLRKLF